ncbi:MAG: hypothetical protein ACLFTK_04370 [Anaerolineales bacterium]
MRRISQVMVLFLPLLAISVSLIALYFTYIERRDARLVVEAEGLDEPAYQALIERSTQNLIRAEDAVAAAELVLGFLEGASILAGLLIVAVGFLGLSSIHDIREDVEEIKQDLIKRLEQAEQQSLERLQRAEQEFITRTEQVAKLEKELEDTYSRGQHRINEQIEAATRQAENAFEALSHHVLAQRLARDNNIDAAIQSCRESHKLDANNVPNNYLLGTLLIRKDQLDEAIQHLTQAFRIDGEDGDSIAPVKAALGLAVRKKGDKVIDTLERNHIYNLAENYLLEAMQQDPHLLNEEKESYFGVLGSLYRRQGRVADAIAAYRRAAQMTPRRSYPEINLAMLYLAQGDPEQFRRHRDMAYIKADRRLQDTPEDYWAKYDVALATLLNEEPDEAARLFDEALELTPDISTLDSVLARIEYVRGLSIEAAQVDAMIQKFQDARQRFLASS